MLTVRFIQPSPDLAAAVLNYGCSAGTLAGPGLRLPMAARADQLLEFYLEDRHRVCRAEGGGVDVAPHVVAAGPQTHRGYDLLVAGTVRTFTIHFRAGWLHHLLGVPMTELTDRGLSALEIAGAEIAALHARLGDAPDDASRVEHVEMYLRRALGRRRPALVSPRAAPRLARGEDVASVARAAGMSARQLERRFQREVGLPPKLFARIARLQRALAWRQSRPGATWSRVAAAAGYADQMHLVRDFRALAGDAPTRFEREREPVTRALAQTESVAALLSGGGALDAIPAAPERTVSRRSPGMSRSF